MPFRRMKAKPVEMSVGAMTVLQKLLVVLRQKNVLTQAEIDALLDDAIAFHESAPPGRIFSAPNERVALLLRAIFNRQ